MPEQGQAVPAMLTEFDVPVPMRDGVVLRAHVTRPADGRPVPVLLARSPYPLEGARFDLDAIGIARRGLAVVLQSARGTGASDGEFRPWADEQADGADTIAWCAAQPWSTGNVATLGRSYLAHTQLYAAAERPAALRAMGLGVVPSEPYDLTYTGGVLALGSSLFWAMSMAGNFLGRRAAAGEDVSADLAEWIAVMGDVDGLYRTAPLAEIPVLDKHFPMWRDWLAHPERDEYWQNVSVPDRDPVPAMVIAGWHDLFLRGSVQQFANRRHPGSRLVIGPWSHGPAGAALGDVDYGLGASGLAINLDGELLDFLAGHLSENPPAGDDAGGVRLFVMGTNRWRTERSWPPESAVQTNLFLHARGRLAFEPPQEPAEPSTFVFDPCDPVPTVGGPNLMPQGDAAKATGSCEQGQLDSRRDILRFVSEPLPRDVEVIGVVTATIHAATSAIDTDWTAKLVDVHPDGRAFNVVDGIVRARYRDPSAGARLLEPDMPHEFRIELGPTAQAFAAGHRIRLDVSSSNFPRFDCNPGTGGSTAETSERNFVRARQSVFHEPGRLSRVTLPITR